MNILNAIKKVAAANPKTIVLVEGEDDRILIAADIILRKNMAKLIILDTDDSIHSRAAKLDLDLFKARIINPSKFELREKYAEKLYNYRKEKGLTLDEARTLIETPIYLGTMLVKENEADGLVSGANHTTAETLKPALQLIKTKVTTASSYFLMYSPEKSYLFADCALNKNPTADELATIALSTAESSKYFDMEPKVAMLSFSTNGSSNDPSVEKVRNATLLAKDRNPELIIYGEIQLDAAIVPKISEKKCPKSPLEGNANVLIFPDLSSANIGYKLVQRFSSMKAIGPIMQGLKKPINDLSRGCDIDDIVNVVAITVIEAQKNERIGN